MIKCPNCETEYLPGEIFVPKYFTGQPKDIEKDYMGKIIWSEGIKQDLVESYICDKCGKSFVVKANITYDVKPDILLNLEPHKTKKYQDRLYLNEV